LVKIRIRDKHPGSATLVDGVTSVVGVPLGLAYLPFLAFMLLCGPENSFSYAGDKLLPPVAMTLVAKLPR
jgi:hypothetical protein